MHTKRSSKAHSLLAIMLSVLLATTLMVPPLAWAESESETSQPTEGQSKDQPNGDDTQSFQPSESEQAGTENPDENTSHANNEQQSASDQDQNGLQSNGVATFALPNSAKTAENVAQVDTTSYTSLADAIAAAEAGDTVTLLADATISEKLVINKRLTLDGAGKTITATGLNPVIELNTTDEVTISKLTVTGAKRGLALCPGVHVTLIGCTLNVSERGIDSQKDIPYENMSIILDNTVINNSGVSNYETQTTYHTDSRGISLYNSKNSVVKVQNESSINGFAYCVNVSGRENSNGVRDTEGLKVEVVDSVLRGWAGFNVWGSLAEYSIISSTVKGINTQNEGANSFAAIVFNDDIYDQFAQTHAENNILNITDSTITNYQGGSCIEDLLRIDCGITALNLSGVVNFVDTTGNVEGALDLEEMSDPFAFLQKQVHRAGGTTVNCTTVDGASLAFAPDYLAYYYRDDGKGGFKGTSRTDFADIVTGNGYTFRAGEYIDLLADVNLAENITVNLEEGTGTFTLNRKGHAITGGTITLPQGVSVKTDAPNEGLFAAAAGCVLLEGVVGDVYTYSAQPEGVAAVTRSDGSAKTYPTLEAAFAAVQNGDKVTLLKDATLTATIALEVADQNVTLDLDGHTVNFGSKYITTKKGELNIINSNPSSEGKLVCPQQPLRVMGNTNASTWSEPRNAKLSIGSNVVVEGSNGPGIYLAGNGAVLDVYGTVRTSANAGGIQGDGNVNATKNCGGTIANVYEGAVVEGTYGVYWPQSGTLNIKGGTITGKSTGIEMRAGTLNMSGGTVVGNGSEVIVNPNASGGTIEGVGIAVAQHTTKLAMNINITGGEISGYSALYESNPQNNAPGEIDQVNLALSGGVFKTINEGSVALYSQNKTGFIAGGTYSSTLDTNYIAKGYYQHATTGTVQQLPETAEYTVEHYWQNVDNDEYSTTPHETETLSGKPYEDTEAAAKSYEGLTVSTDPIVQKEIAPEGTTVVKVYYDRNTYKVTWNPAGGTLSGATQTQVRFGAPIPQASATKDGFLLAGWSDMPEAMPADNIELTARWAPVVKPTDPSVNPDLDIAVDIPAINPDPTVPSATITEEAKQTAVSTASQVLDAVSQGIVPPGVTPEEAARINEVVGKDPSHKITAVVSVSVEQKTPDDIAEDASRVDGALNQDQEVAVYFDIKVNLIVRNETTGKSTNATLTNLEEPLVFEVHVSPDLIAGKAVRIACVHEGNLRWIDPISVDYETGVILLSADAFSTYAVVTSSTVEVAFESNGGSAVPTQTVAFRGKVTKPADPTRSGYAFAGWYADAALTQPWDFDTTVSSYMTLYAKWTAVSGGETPKAPGALGKTGDSLGGAATLLVLGMAIAAGAVMLSARLVAARRKR
ncbi:InlB B-repeat-containing protein [Eggerthella sp. YY7918]|uniref:InlB B-repeat-containing protein n=1 Tax=Eggerthella sp. (strain YY7918) TaxID=502558 RepID=UPI0002170EF4|nr:InlB B-repeat-containing protein [Eggerthella sp. YY7918]BAK43670.1 hypothetical protein EGYY_04570 [Eggerthella sp. YY7918]